jgi:eukaryotic-like serine/threonine-protein kinase
LIFNQNVPFDSSKHFKYIRPLGKGGTGDIHLFKDETANMLFAIKKYDPKNLEHIDDNYQRFVNEMKMLFKISHPNIVRIYNYYLYPRVKTGFLQMEFIEGTEIDKYSPEIFGKQWDEIFIEIINTFVYLESMHILHRDIRPANILIDKDENVKLIDFGFSKVLENEEQCGHSILLNWPATEYPEEIVSKNEYNHQTEIFFIGKLFQKILDKEIDDFKFNHIVNIMIELKPEKRYGSFIEISNAISSGILSEISFIDSEKETYLNFANTLSEHIKKFIDSYDPINDPETTIKLLSKVLHDNSLEKYIQINSKLIDCFVSGRYTYST